MESLTTGLPSTVSDRVSIIRKLVVDYLLYEVAHALLAVQAMMFVVSHLFVALLKVSVRE